jgi:hypothetical protein
LNDLAVRNQTLLTIEVRSKNLSQTPNLLTETGSDEYFTDNYSINIIQFMNYILLQNDVTLVESESSNHTCLL